METALRAALERMKRSKPDMTTKNSVYAKAAKNAQRLHEAFRHTEEWYSPRPLRARLVHLPPRSKYCKPLLSTIRATDVGTVIQICGTCVRTGPIRMVETMRTYRCLEKGCGHRFAVNADFATSSNGIRNPGVCPRPDGECFSTNFARTPDGTYHADYQEMKVQESASAMFRRGNIPRSLTVKLCDDLVEKCTPGDEVVVVGSLNAEWPGNGGTGEVLVGLSMKAHSVRVVNIDEEYTGGRTSTMTDVAVVGGNNGTDAVTSAASSSGNLREKFRREFDIFWSSPAAQQHPIGTRDYIARAVCPKLYGMQAVKLGLLLVLIGGASVADEVPVEEDEEEEEEQQTQQTQETSEQVIEVDSDEEAPEAFKIGGDDDSDGDVGNDEPTKRDTEQSEDMLLEVSKQTKPKNNKPRALKSRRRNQSHILLIGDPGTGKSQFLRFAAEISHRSVLTTGTGSSTAGLTCAAVRDPGAAKNEFSLEAGALALADRGVCCIDEFGCMSKDDRTSIHEAMEQQTISVAKAGIICKLKARTTVVAVMNPQGGIYDTGDSLELNAKLGSALLSRFDLIFVMLDQAEHVRDNNIARFLLNQSIKPGSGYERPLAIETLENNGNAGHWNMEKLRAYLATVRSKFHPTLTPEASELLEKHYSSCRQYFQEGNNDGTYNNKLLITVRFLESLVRLSQAHARLMYRDKVLVDDAVAVILLMECTEASLSNHFDDFMQKSPVDTEFRSFDTADAIFEEEKEKILQRYANRPNNNGEGQQVKGVSSQPHRNNQHEAKYQTWDNFGQHEGSHHHHPAHQAQARTDLRDQWGRQYMSQSQSPYPSSTNASIMQAMNKMGTDQSTPTSSHGSNAGQHSGNRVTFSNEVVGTVNNQIEIHGSHYVNSNNMHDADYGSCNFGAPSEHLMPRSGGFLHQHDEDHMPVQTGTFTQERMGGGNEKLISQQVDNFRTNTNRSQHTQQQRSSRKQKKRRTAD